MTTNASGTNPVRNRARRTTAGVLSAGLVAAGLTAIGLTGAAPAQAAEQAVTNATFTWGLNGYAQRGIFGPWTYKDLAGNVTQLTGSVSGGTQTEYVVAPIPTTSMPATTPVGSAQKTPNAVKFTAGTGTADPATDAVNLSWTGSYTVNAYPAMYNAPDEIYSDPQLTLDADGDGEMTMNFALGAGADMEGNPTPAVDLGRLPVMTFSDGSAVDTSLDSFRATPDYQGVNVSLPESSSPQATCTAGSGATGWWGSWPQEFVENAPESVRPHFYSTGCGGYNDNKPALPVDVDLGLTMTPAVTVSDTTLLPNGLQEITVTGQGFDPSLATGTRPPFAGQASGTYIAFGRYADVWRPSAGAPSSARTNPSGDNGNGVAVRWAVPEASFAASSPAQTLASSPAYLILNEDGSFTTTIKVDQSWLAEAAGNFGIYTYAGGGANVASYETYTPITFAKATPAVSVTSANVVFGKAASASVAVTSEGGNTGSVTLNRGNATVGTAPLVNGRATFALGRLGAGRYPLTASYTGNENTDATTAATTLVVAKANTTTRARVAPKPRRKKAGRAVITVVSPSGKVAGKATTVLRNAKGKAVTKVRTVKIRNGKATVKLPRLAKGRYRLVVKFVATSNLKTSTRKVVFRVA